MMNLIIVSILTLALLSFLIISFGMPMQKRKRGQYINLEALIKHNVQISFAKRLHKQNAISDKEHSIIKAHIDEKYISKKGEASCKK